LNEGAITKTRRRRRSWYRRRLRIQRTLVALLVVVVLAGACWQNVARHFLLPSFHVSQVLPDSFWARQTFHRDPAIGTVRPFKTVKSPHRIPGVYPYSVVPGGVRNLDELRNAAAHDATVRRHYSHFDFGHAKLIRLPETREVFLSYRIRDTVFWTRKRVRLQPGELLLTDGTTTARARCGNQISDTAKPEVSNEEPDEDVLDQPVVAVASGPFLPVRPVLGAPELPAGQPNPPALFAGGFVFPFVPVGVPLPRICRADEMNKDGRCVPHRKPVVPEPSTMLLLASGLAVVGWRYRKSLGSAAA
jgi:hypothetical protein